jgi:predicted Fe-Mo cluster-binding NifX family protein
MFFGFPIRRGGGAGTKAAETVADLNAERVISGDFGPKAKALLEQFKHTNDYS